jgi:hypothetical protein
MTGGQTGAEALPQPPTALNILAYRYSTIHPATRCVVIYLHLSDLRLDQPVRLLSQLMETLRAPVRMPAFLVLLSEPCQGCHHQSTTIRFTARISMRRSFRISSLEIPLLVGQIRPAIPCNSTHVLLRERIQACFDWFTKNARSKKVWVTSQKQTESSILRGPQIGRSKWY